MGNPKKNSEQYQPNKHGHLSKSFDGNKGRKYQTKGKEAVWIQPKGN
ncbi:small acid-soluble spore protein N [Salinibacillus kushneri]|nr:small acid-soluble spore protein N [Salinibacillus kushneri]